MAGRALWGLSHCCKCGFPHLFKIILWEEDPRKMAALYTAFPINPQCVTAFDYTIPFFLFFAFFWPEILVEVLVGRAQTGGGGGEGWKNLGQSVVTSCLSLPYHCMPGLALLSARMRTKQSSSRVPGVSISIAGGLYSRLLTRTSLYFQRGRINGTPDTA